MQFPLVGGQYVSQSPLACNEQTINWFYETMESPNGVSKAQLYPWPGLSLLLTLPGGAVRGMMTQNGRTFAVGGAVLYEINTGAMTATALGTMVVDTNPCTFATNGPAGHQVIVTSGGQTYLFDLNSSTFTNVMSGATYAGFVVYLDGYFVVLDTANATIYLSALEDGTSWSGSAQRNTAGDKWQALIASHRQLWLTGSQRSDVWYDSGDANFPFAPVDGAFIEQGIIAPYSLTEVDNAPMWIGSNETGAGIMWRANGYQAQRVSDFSFEYALSQYSTISDAVGWTMQYLGHAFYIVNFPTANATWCWDASNGKLIELGDWVSSAMMFTAYRPQYHVFTGQQHLVGDRTTGAISVLDIQNQLGADGAVIRRVRRTPTFVKENRRLFMGQAPAFIAYLEPGLGTSTGAGMTPQMMWRQSTDGGKTWGAEQLMAAGVQGAWRQRVIMPRFNAGRQQTFEVSVTDPIPWRIVDGFIQLEVGTS